MKRIAILGSTGSIGRSALAVVEAHRDRVQVVALAAGENATLLAEQIAGHEPALVGVATEAARDELARRLTGVVAGASVHVLAGFATVAKQGAQGAALLADGLAGGRSAALVDAMGIREASGTVLDHLYLISQAAARARLGIA